MRTNCGPEWLREAVSLIQNFRPYVSENLKRSWHDQVKGFLFVVGAMLKLAAIPEYPIPSPSLRHGTARIDMVWLAGSEPVAAFEIEGGIKERSVRKLRLLDAPYKFVVSGGKSGQEMKWLGSPRLAGTDIEHIVVVPTDDPDVCTETVFHAVDQMIECEVVFEGATVETELSDFPRP